jgi:hypothetical protein
MKPIDYKALFEKYQGEDEQEGHTPHNTGDKLEASSFDPSGLLAEILRRGYENGQTDEEVLGHVEAAIKNGSLTAPWGLMVKDSPLIGDYWIISCEKARERVPREAMSFTLDELKPVVEASRVFKGSRMVKLIWHKGKGAVNA